MNLPVDGQIIFDYPNPDTFRQLFALVLGTDEVGSLRWQLSSNIRVLQCHRRGGGGPMNTAYNF